LANSENETITEKRQKILPALKKMKYSSVMKGCIGLAKKVKAIQPA
jgi:hypothetical protein